MRRNTLMEDRFPMTAEGVKTWMDTVNCDISTLKRDAETMRKRMCMQGAYIEEVVEAILSHLNLHVKIDPPKESKVRVVKHGSLSI